MSKTREAPNQSKSSQTTDGPDQAGELRVDPDAHVPLKPRPILLVFLGFVLIVLLGMMLALYFKTVYPYRSAPHVTEQDTLTLPNSNPNLRLLPAPTPVSK